MCEDGSVVVRNGLVLLEPQGPQGVLTRARHALPRWERLCLVYDCSYEAVLQGLVAQISSRRLSSIWEVEFFLACL